MYYNLLISIHAIHRFKVLILRAVYAILILFRGNKKATEFLIACILLTMQIIEILRAKILKQILLRLFCRERLTVTSGAFLRLSVKLHEKFV